MNSGIENGGLDLLRIPHLQTKGSYDEGGALIIQVQSREATFRQCCLLRNLRKNGSRIIRFRDHAVQGRQTWLEIKQQRFQCKACGETIYEEFIGLDGKRRVTGRFRDHLFKAATDLSFTTAARVNGVDETLARRIFEEQSNIILAGYIPKMPEVLGMDEIYLHGRARFVIGDVGNRRMLDMQPSRRDLDIRGADTLWRRSDCSQMPRP